MKKICVVHGVGFFNNDQPKEYIAKFVEELRAKTCAEVSVHRWEHIGEPPVDPRNSWMFKTMRAWTHEIIMDFSYVISNLEALTAALPEADMYVGHSAGGIVISQSHKPQVLMGCPLQLMLNTQIRAETVDIVNMMHYRDPIASPVIGAYNIVTHSPFIAGLLNPVKAHTGYWESPEVMRRIVEFYNIRVRGE